MKSSQWLIPFLCFILFARPGQAQSVEITYYKDQECVKEAPAGKARFSKTVTHNADSSVTTEIKNLKTGSLLSSCSWKGAEPVGKWIQPAYESKNSMKVYDYDFKVNYTDTTCGSDIEMDLPSGSQDSIPDLPKTIDGLSLPEYISQNIEYPLFEVENNIQGTVYMKCRIKADGVIEHIHVVKGVDIGLDKEAVRVLRSVKLAKGIIVDGKPKTVCVSLPVRFILQ